MTEVEEPGPGRSTEPCITRIARWDLRRSAPGSRAATPPPSGATGSKVKIVHYPDLSPPHPARAAADDRPEQHGRKRTAGPARPQAQQPGRHPRAGHQDDQQAGVSPVVGVGFRSGPGGGRHRVGRGDDLVLGVVQLAELRVDLYRQALGRQALGTPKSRPW